MTANLAATFLGEAGRNPGRTAVVDAAGAHTYGELALEVRRVAAWLLAEAGHTAPRVGILAERSFGAFASMLGACMAGAAYVPLPVDGPAARLDAILGCAGVGALVTDRPRSALGPLGALPSRVLGPEQRGVLEGITPAAACMTVDTEALAYLMFTSGTTGRPRAVEVTVGNVRAFLDAAHRRAPRAPTDRASQFYDLTFDPSVYDIFLTLEAGASLHVVPPTQRMAPARFIRDERLTIWSSVPSVVPLLQRTKALSPGAFPELRLTMFCGEPLTLACIDAWRLAAPSSTIDNEYGPTEATVTCVAERYADPPRVTPGRGTLAIGVPVAGMRAAVVDAEGRFLGREAVGELALHGPQVARGYLGEPALTASRFRMLSHPEHGRSRWYLTGDRALEDADGHFHHLGRLDHQVKVLGRRVELEEVESHLREVTGGACVVLAWPVVDGVAAGLVAFIEGDVDDTLPILRALEARLPRHMVPKQLFAMAALPRGSSGKLDRQSLERRLASGLLP